MNTPERQRYALQRPLGGPQDVLGARRQIDEQPDGNLLVTILAVDR